MKKIIVSVFVVLVLLAGSLTAYIYALYGRMSRVSQGQVIQKYSSEKAALLVIDVQESLTGELSTPFSKGMRAQSVELVNAINKVVEWAERSGMPVIYIKQENTDFIYNLMTGAMLAKGRPGTEIDKRVKVSGNNIFGKQMMDAFTNPGLDAFLRSNEVSSLYVTGLDAAYCVDMTIKGGLARGYKVTVVKDAVISNKTEVKDKMLAEYAAAGVVMSTADELVREK